MTPYPLKFSKRLKLVTFAHVFLILCTNQTLWRRQPQDLLAVLALPGQKLIQCLRKDRPMNTWKSPHWLAIIPH